MRITLASSVARGNTNPFKRVNCSVSEAYLHIRSCKGERIQCRSSFLSRLLISPSPHWSISPTWGLVGLLLWLDSQYTHFSALEQSRVQTEALLLSSYLPWWEFRWVDSRWVSFLSQMKTISGCCRYKSFSLATQGQVRYAGCKGRIWFLFVLVTLILDFILTHSSSLYGPFPHFLCCVVNGLCF